MTLPGFEYTRPKTMKDLITVVDEHRTGTKILAGGTDLMVSIRDTSIRPQLVVDIKGVKELHELSWSENEGLTIGSAVTLNELMSCDIVKSRFHVLWKAASVLADPIIRNRATLVGNICNASPAADTAPALLILGARVEAVSEEGTREIPIQQFFRGVKRTALMDSEFVRSVRIPDPPEGARGEYLKWGRIRGEDLAVVGVAGLVSGSSDVRVALSSVAPTPLLISGIRSIFDGGGQTEEEIEGASMLVQEAISPISDVRASSEYRRHMAGVLTKRLLTQLLGVR